MHNFLKRIIGQSPGTHLSNQFSRKLSHQTASPPSPLHLHAAQAQPRNLSRPHLFQQPETANCGVGILSSHSTLTAKDLLAVVDCNAARGARNQNGDSDGNSILFRKCEDYLCKLYPKFTSEIQGGNYQIVNAHMPQDEKNGKKAESMLQDIFKQLGIPIVAGYEQPINQSALSKTDYKYPRRLTHFLIIKPDPLDISLIHKQNLVPFKMMGIDPTQPLSDFNFWRICQLVYVRILLHPTNKFMLDMVSVDPSLTFTSLVREEIIKDYYPDIAHVTYQEGIVQTRASTRTNVTMIGNHGGLRQENGENTNIAQIAQRITSSFEVKKLLGFAPDLSSLPDTHLTAIYYALGILVGLNPYEAYAHVAPLVDPHSYAETPLTRLITASRGTPHQGPFMAFTRFPTPHGISTLMHKDPHADRPGFGIANSEKIQYGSSRQIELVPGGTPVSAVPGAPVLLHNGTATYLEEPQIQQRAQEIWDSIPVLPNQFDSESETPYSEAALNAIRNANFLRTDMESTMREIFETSNRPAVAMGIKRPYTGNNPFMKTEFVRGTAPPKNEAHKNQPGDFSLILGRQETELSRSLCDPSYWTDTFRIDSPILTPNQYNAIQNRATSQEVVAVMPQFCNAETMVKIIEQLAEQAIDLIKNGAGCVIIKDFDRENFLQKLPLPHMLVFGHIQRRLAEEKLLGAASLILHTNWVTDMAELGPTFSFGCSAMYVEPIFRKEFDTPFTKTPMGRKNWAKAGEKVLADFCGASGLQNFRCFIGNLSTVSGSLVTKDVLEFVGLSPENASSGINSFERIAALWNSRFALTENPSWNNTGDKVVGTVRFSGRDPRNPQVVQAIRSGDYEGAIKEIIKHSDQPIDRVKLNPKYTPPRLVYHIYGFGPAGMTAFNTLWEDAKTAGKRILIRIFYRSPLGLARQAMFPNHSDRILGISQQTAHNLEEALLTDSVETIGNVTITDNSVHELKGYCHHDIDARGALKVKMPDHPRANLFTPPDWVYLSYSAGVTALNKTEESYRAIPAALRGKNVNFTASLGGGDVAVDQALWATTSGDELRDTWAIGEEERVRPRVAHIFAYRQGPAQIPAGTHDLDEFEKKGGKVLAIFDKKQAEAQAADSSPLQQQKVDWWMKRWNANTIDQIRWDIIPGQTIAAFFGTKFTDINVSSFNPNLINLSVDQETPAGSFPYSFAVAYTTPCFGYESITTEPITTLTVGQRDASQVGNIPSVVAATRREVHSHLKQQKEHKRYSEVPALPRVTAQNIVGAGGFTWNTHQTNNFLNSMTTPVPLSSQEIANKLFMFERKEDENPKQTKKDMEQALLSYLNKENIRPDPHAIIVHDVNLNKTFSLAPSDFKKEDNLLSVLDRIYYKDAKANRGMSESCGQEGTCGTCFGFEIPKKKRDSDSLNISKTKELTSLLCTVKVDANNLNSDELGRIFIIGSPEIKTKKE